MSSVISLLVSILWEPEWEDGATEEYEASRRTQSRLLVADNDDPVDVLSPAEGLRGRAR